MILKKLTATGFKSFADKTEFDFDRGITCIVGPNGCGKSNVVDAIKWVLGEQSAKSLRGKNMLDVIFNGSGTRKSGNMAQVDLTFDNGDGTLAIDQSEVVITRRLYRSGESEYLINKQPARLKDIRELFLDTGIGVDAYSVIEQGRVDLMLQANPQERRAIFEEAAGINKYKHQKKEALRRLDRVNQNLQRVQDVVEELEKRLRSVKLAAGKARNYETYVGRLRELRSRHALSEYHRLRVSHDELSKAAAELHDRVTSIRTDLSSNEARTSETNVRIVDAEREIQSVESRLTAVQTQISAHQERIAASERRIADQQGLLDRSRERLSQFDEQVAALTARTMSQREAAAAIETELAATSEEQGRCQEEDTACAHELNEKKSALDEAKESIFELARRTSQLHNEIQGMGIQRESLVAQRSKLSARAEEISTALGAANQARAQRDARRSEIDTVVGEKTQTLEETRSRMAEAARQRSALIDQIAAAKEHRSGLESRRQLLEEMDARHEGLLAGAREILERRDADGEGATFGYVLGAVGELFETDVSHARLVEAVLGHLETCLVVTERELLVGDMDRLEELSGRVQAFCLDSIPPYIGSPDLSSQEGFVAHMLDWVRVPESCGRLARHLLGRTYVVQSLDAAARMSRLDPGARFVTLDGVVCEADGRVGIGALGSDTGLISRRSELRELTRELEEVAGRIERMAAEMQSRDSEVSHLEQMQQDLRTALYQINTERVEVQAAISSLETTIKQLEAERPHVLSDIETLTTRLAEIDAKESDAKQSLVVVEQRYLDAEQLSGRLQTEMEELSTRRQAISERITSLRVRVGELSQRRSSVAETLRELEAAAIQLDADRRRAERDVTEAQERIEQSLQQIEEARATLAELTEENASLLHKSMSLRQERDGLREVGEQLVRDARRLRNDLESVEADLHEREIKLQEARVRIEDLTARIAEELSVDLAVQYETYAPDTEEDWPAIEAEINDLRQKIERLGNVNLDAIREQEELEERLAFLTTQLEDLRTSEKQLTALIERLNKESEQRFVETFNAVAEHFSKLFKKLFGGGKAEIMLMDMNDVLECGIEITARPPGKEPRNISQLSGGEKTMTAIALLMAVFRSRPSPFVLLDEVDAALDEANNMRFNNVVREFVELAQFIVITHSKRTMSVGDVMYGVTMQEAGVSKRVSVRFDDERQTGAAVA